MIRNLLFVLAFILLGTALKVDSDTRAQFRSFVRTYGKRYAADEFQHRFQAFKDNLKRVDRLNKEHERDGYTGHFAVNEFSDLSPKEFSARKKGYKPINLRPRDDHEVAVDDGSILAGPLPASWDWRTKGAVSPVKNQGDCGSCWAFSTTEGVESGYFLAGNKLPVLAPQQIVDCSTANQGCGGGNLPPALDYVMKCGGMEPETAYPYSGSNGNCKFTKAKVVATLKSWKYATKSANETSMQVFSYARGPLSICVDAASWQNYNSGVIKHTCGKSLDHCVQIVGWGVTTAHSTSSTGSTSGSSSSSGSSSTNSPSPTTSTTKFEAKELPYWIVRNSWGTSWGLQGYLWVERGNNECGIAQEAIYPEA